MDVLHTNALEKGKLEPSGTVDFFANGGMAQPGCKTSRDQSKYNISLNCTINSAERVNRSDEVTPYIFVRNTAVSQDKSLRPMCIASYDLQH